MDDKPANSSVMPGYNVRKDMLYAVSLKIVDMFIDLEANFTIASTPQAHDDDKILEYSKLVMSIGMLYFEYCVL